jgi:hypothetical protein
VANRAQVAAAVALAAGAVQRLPEMSTVLPRLAGLEDKASTSLALVALYGTPAVGDVLAWNGIRWTNQSPTAIPTGTKDWDYGGGLVPSFTAFSVDLRGAMTALAIAADFGSAGSPVSP